MDVEVQADEEDASDQERHKSEEDQLLEKTRLLRLDCELVLFLGELVAATLEEQTTDFLHSFLFFFTN